VPTIEASGSTPAAAGGDEAVRVFMSYRRTDDINFTGRFHDKLVGVFGEANVFRDIDSIPAGTRFEDVINDHLAGVDAVVAMIGPTWSARLGSPSDFVRMEIAQALRSGTPVIPVLIEDTAFPARESLPDDLQPLLDRQAVRVRRDPDFHRDAARVIEGVREAVESKREREAELRRAAEEEAAQKRAAVEMEEARAARRRELEAQLARADARAAEERRAAEALEQERAERLAELTRLEEEMTRRRIDDERARLAAIAESQAQRERDAAAAATLASDLRSELAELDQAGPDQLIDPKAPEVAEAELLPAEPPRAEPVSAVLPEDEPTAPAAPVVPPHSDVTAAPDDRARTSPWFPSRTADWIGCVLIVVATIWAVWAMFRRELDGANALSFPWGIDVAAVSLTAALLLPLLCFRYPFHPAAVSAGASLGYLAFQGFPWADWFWNDEHSGDPFPTYMVFIAVVLLATWFAFRIGRREHTEPVRHRPSYVLQIVGSVAAAVAVLFFADLLYDWTGYYTPRVWVVYFVGTVAMIALSTLRSRDASISLALTSAACCLTFLAYVIHVDFWRARAWNVVIASGIVAATAIWRYRRPRNV
jgi:hypothetical protein